MSDPAKSKGKSAKSAKKLLSGTQRRVHKASAARARVAKKRSGKDELKVKATAAAPTTATPKVTTKAKTKPMAEAKGPDSKGKTLRRIRGDALPWKAVNTSTLPGMDGGGGMMMLEELDGVGVEWEDDGEGRKTARFVTRDVEETAEEEKEDEEDEEQEGDEEEDEEDAGQDEESESEDALPTFAGMDTADLNDADDEQTVEAEPYFDDRKLPAWKGVGVHATLKRGMAALQFKNPTEIQHRAVPLALEGRDVVGVAETGSGKTLAYSLPILSWLLRQPAPKAGVHRPLAALVLCPTRELAIQVNDHLLKVVTAALPDDKDGKKPKVPRISIGSIVGGLSAHKQKRVLERGCDILVATPGRLWDLMKMDDTLAASVRALRFLVIDEADRMIETGHFAELENIVGLTQRHLAPQTEDDDDPVFAQAATQLTETAAREDMQTFVFSATLSKDLQVNLKKRRRAPRKAKSSTLEDLVDRLDFRDESPAVIDLSPEGGLVATLREAMVECVPADKDLYLYYFLLRYPGRSLVFTTSIDGIRRLIPLFETLNVPVWPLHSQLQQKQRLKNLERFKSASNGVLIATDVAARGLDIPHVDHVIHFNLPRTADNYVHRSGRTARAQNPGFALQLVSPEDRGVQRALLKSLDRSAPPPDLEIDGGFLPKLKERIAVARDIEKAMHATKKENHDRNWLKEAAEAMDIDIDPDMFSDDEHDPDLPYAAKKGAAGSRARNAAKVPDLKAKLAHLLAQPLLARGVSARYPTSGSRVVVHDMVQGTAHSNMLGANVGAAYEMVDVQALKRKRPKGDEEKGAPPAKVGKGKWDKKDNVQEKRRPQGKGGKGKPKGGANGKPAKGGKVGKLA